MHECAHILTRLCDAKQTQRAVHVQLDRLVEALIEIHDGSAVNDHIHLRVDESKIRRAQPDLLLRQLTCERAQLVCDATLECCRSDLSSQSRKHLAAHNLAVHSLERCASLPRSHEHIQAADLRHRAKNLLHDHLSDETCRAGQEHTATTERLQYAVRTSAAAAMELGQDVARHVDLSSTGGSRCRSTATAATGAARYLRSCRHGRGGREGERERDVGCEVKHTEQHDHLLIVQLSTVCVGGAPAWLRGCVLRVE